MVNLKEITISYRYDSIVGSAVGTLLVQMHFDASILGKDDSFLAATGIAAYFILSPSARKSFGFIAQENGPDVFAHFRQIVGDGFKTLTEGQRVEFTVTQGQKGPQAEEIRPL